MSENTTRERIANIGAGMVPTYHATESVNEAGVVVEQCATATERLRKLLDERGVEWKEHKHAMPGSMAIQRETLWGQPIDNTTGKPIPHVYHNRATEMGDGRLFLEAQLVTPEQAIGVTLGPGTCHDLAETPDYRDKTEFKCSECGYEYSAVGGFGCDYGDEPDFNFCPNCGRKVVDE